MDIFAIGIDKCETYNYLEIKKDEDAIKTIKKYFSIYNPKKIDIDKIIIELKKDIVCLERLKTLKTKINIAHKDFLNKL